MFQSGSDELVADQQAKIARIEAELQLEKEKYQRLRRDMSDTQTHSTSHEAHAQSLEITVQELQVRGGGCRRVGEVKGRGRG